MISKGFLLVKELPFIAVVFAAFSLPAFAQNATPSNECSDAWGGGYPSSIEEVERNCPVIRSAAQGNLTGLKTALTSGHSPNETLGGEPAIFWAQTAEIFKVLIEAGADLNVISQNGFSAATYSADSFADLGLLKLLAQKGIDVTLPDRYGKTILHVAVGQGHINIVNWALQKGVDVNAQDRSSRTAFHKVFLNHRNENNLEIIEALFKAGARIDIPNESGLTIEYNCSNQLSYHEKLCRAIEVQQAQ